MGIGDSPGAHRSLSADALSVIGSDFIFVELLLPVLGFMDVLLMRTSSCITFTSVHLYSWKLLQQPAVVQRWKMVRVCSCGADVITVITIYEKQAALIEKSQTTSCQVTTTPETEHTPEDRRGCSKQRSDKGGRGRS